MKFKKILFVVLFSFFTVLFFGCAKKFSLELINVKTVDKKINTTNIKKNTKIDFEVIKKEGHTFKELLINGEDKTSLVKDYKFTYTVDKNLKIEAVLKKDEQVVPEDKFYKLELENVELLTKDINLNKVKENTLLEFLINKKENQKVVSLLINGEEKKDILRDNKFTLKMDKNYKIVATLKDEDKVEYYKFELEGVKALNPGIDLNKIEENTKVEFELVTPTDKILDKLLINDEDKTSLVSDNKFSVIANSNKKIKATYRDYNYYKIELDGVSLTDSKIDKDNVKETSVVEFILNTPSQKKIKELLIDDVKQDLGIIKDDKFTWKITKDTKIKAVYELDVNPILRYNDKDLSEENATSIYEKEAFTFNYVGCAPSDIKVKTSGSLSYSLDIPNQKVTIDPFTNQGEEIVEVEFYFDSDKIVRKFKLNVLKNQLLEDKAKLDALYNNYKVLEGMKDRVFNADLDLIKTYVDSLAQVVDFADKLNDYLPILTSQNLFFLGQFIEYSNSNKSYVEAYKYGFLGSPLFKFFIKDKFLDDNILSPEVRTEMATYYNGMKDAHNNIKKFLSDLSSFVNDDEYLIKEGGKVVGNKLAEKLKSFKKYLDYYNNLLKLRDDFDFLKDIDNLDNEYDIKNFKNNSDYLLYLETAGSNDEFIKLRKKVFDRAETNPKTCVKDVNFDGVADVVEDLLNVAKKLRAKVVPAGELKVEYLNKNIEGIYNFAQYFVKYIAILEKNNHVVEDYNYIGVGSFRKRVYDLYNQIFQIDAKPVKLDGESDEDFQKRLESWQEKRLLKSEVVINVIESYCEKENVDKTKQIATPIYTNIDKLIEEVDDQGGQKVFSLLKKLKERNDAIKEIQDKI